MRATRFIGPIFDRIVRVRTIVSGIAEYYKPEDMVGKQVCVLINLEPRKIKGIESQGMILMAKQADGKMCLMQPSEKMLNGAGGFVVVNSKLNTQHKMDSTPLVSIALCTYNGAVYLKEQVNSLLNQTYARLEIIAIDDCSTDNTVAILREYEQQHPNFRVFVNERNLGYNKNFERALLLCQGEYIAISDQDDIWLPEKIEVLMTHIGSNSLIYSNSARIDANGDDLAGHFLGQYVNFYRGNDPRALLMKNIVPGHTLLFKRDLLDDVIPLPVNMVYDWWLAMAAANRSGITFVTSDLVKHREHHNSAGMRKRREHHNSAGMSIGGKSKPERLPGLKCRVEQMLNLKHLRYRTFYEKFDRLLTKMPGGGFALFWFGARYYKILCVTSTRNSLSKINYLRRWLF